jgi:hypothetical protein
VQSAGLTPVLSAGSMGNMNTTGQNTTESLLFTTQQSASGWEKSQYTETVGYSPTGQSGIYNTDVKSHSESQYDVDAQMTSGYSGSNATSNTFVHYHAKGSGSADATDRETGIIGAAGTTGTYHSYATGQIDRKNDWPSDA